MGRSSARDTRFDRDVAIKILPEPPGPPGLHDATRSVTGTSPAWDGTHFDLPWAIDVIRFNAKQRVGAADGNA